MCFNPLTHFTSINIFADIMLHSRPPIIAGDEFSSFIATRMSSKGSVVIFADNVFLELGVNGNINVLAKGNKSIFQLFPTFFFVV